MFPRVCLFVFIQCENTWGRQRTVMNMKNSLNFSLLTVLRNSRRMPGLVSTVCHQSRRLIVIQEETNSLPGNNYGPYTSTLFRSTCRVIWSSLTRLLEYIRDFPKALLFVTLSWLSLEVSSLQAWLLSFNGN